VDILRLAVIALLLFFTHCNVQGVAYTANNEVAVTLSSEEGKWAKKNPISIAVVDNWFPFSFRSPTDELIGYHLDLLTQLEANIGVTFDIKRFEHWKDAIAAVESGSVHSLIGASPSLSRSDSLYLSSIYLFSQTDIFSKKINATFKQSSDLVTARFAVIEGDVLNGYVKDRFPKAIIIPAKDEQQLFELVNNNRADVAIVVNAGDVSYQFSSFNIIERLVTQGGEFRIATSNKNEMIANIIEKGISSVSIPQKQAIFDKWLSDSSDHSIFNQKELHYLRKHPVLSVGNVIWPQIIGHNRDGFIGATSHILNQLETIMGVEFIPIYAKKSSLNKAIEKGNLDVIAGITSDKYHYDKGLFSQNYFSLPLMLFSDKIQHITEISDLSFQKIAITQSLYNNLSDNLLTSKIDFKVVRSNESAFDLLDAKNVNFVFSSELLLPKLLKDRGIKYKRHTLTDIWPIGFRFVIPKKSSVLQSILQKSISHIQHNNLNADPSKLKIKRVKILNQHAQLPYFSETDIVKGISHDIVVAAFTAEKIKVTQFSAADDGTLDELFTKNQSVEVISMTKKSDETFFYSDELMSYTNVVVSKLDRNFHFKEIEDLNGRALMTWDGASNDLGNEFHRLFNVDNRPENYREFENQKMQIEMLIDNKVDAIVIDRTILDWYINQMDPTIITELKIDHILPSTQPRFVAFKDKRLRDVFNIQLQRLKKSGEYQTIFNRYTHGSIRVQVKLTNLISELFAKGLRENDNKTIDDLGKILVALKYIDHIKMTTLNNTVRTFGKKTPLSQSSHERIFFKSHEIPIPIGNVTINFSPRVLSAMAFSNNYIPLLGKFKHLSEFEYIESIYQSLGYSDKKIEFTAQEIKYLSDSPEIKYTDSNWKPLIFDLNNKNVGIVVDYLSLIAQKTGLKFIYQPSKNWSNAKEKFNQKSVDILPSTDKNSDKGLQSIPYVEFKYAIVKRGNGTFADSLLDLENKKVVVIKNFSPARVIKSQYPQIKLIEANDVSQALTMLSDGRADAFVGHSAVAWHSVVNYFPTLKVVGMTDDLYAHRMLIQHDNPVLVSIINKAINDITYEESSLIRHRWIERQQAVEKDYSLIWKIIISFSLMLLIGYFFMHKIMVKNKLIEKSNHRLNLTVDDLTIMQKSLTIKTQALQEQKENFESLFSEAALGSLLIQSGRVVDCNNALVEHLEYDNKSDLLFFTVEDFSPTKQPNGKHSNKEIVKYTNRCLKMGTVSFEWVILTKRGNEIWCNVVLTKMSMNNTDVVHAVISDISDRKLLEQEILTHNIALQSKNKELEKSLDHLNKAQNQLIESEKLASLGELVAGIAHEINTPVGIGLTGISHFSAITKDISNRYIDKNMSKNDFEKYLEESSDVAHLVLRNLERTAELVSSFKRVSVDQSSEEKRQFEINEYVNEILISLSNILKHTNLEIILHCDTPLIINSYPGAFYQILSNLIINSNIHGYPDKESGIVNISIKLANDRIVIGYRDDGRGIPKKSLSKIFDPFYTTNRENGGSGLGLNIIYNIVTGQLNGSIKCESQLGEGVNFTISYPVNVM